MNELDQLHTMEGVVFLAILISAVLLSVILGYKFSSLRKLMLSNKLKSDERHHQQQHLIHKLIEENEKHFAHVNSQNDRIEDEMKKAGNGLPAAVRDLNGQLDRIEAQTRHIPVRAADGRFKKRNEKTS